MNQFDSLVGHCQDKPQVTTMRKHGQSIDTVCGVGNSSTKFRGDEKVNKITYHEMTRSYSWPVSETSEREPSARPVLRYSVL